MVDDPDRNLRLIGGVWKVRWYEGEKQKTVSLHTKNKAEARILKRRVMARVQAERQGHRIADPAPEGPRRATWEDVVEAYRASQSFKKLGERTRRRYLIDLRRVGAFLAEVAMFPGEADLPAVVAFVREMDDDGMAPQSIRNALTAFSRAMVAARAVGKVQRNPVDEYERGDIGEGARMNPPLNGEFERILPEVREWDEDLAMFVDFLHRTGCRATETLLARADDLMDGGRQLRLHRGVKGDRGRSIFLNAAEELLARLPDRGRLFPGLSEQVAVVSSQWGSFWRARIAAETARVAALRAALPPGTPERLMPQPDPWRARRWRLHDHRHAFAIESIVAGCDIYELSRHLGHRSVKTTEGYLKDIERLPVPLQRGLRLPPRSLRGPAAITGDEEQPAVPEGFEVVVRRAMGH